MPDSTLNIVVATQHGVVLAHCLAETFGTAVRMFAPVDKRPAASVNGTIERFEMPVSQQIGVRLREGIPLVVIAPIAEVVPLLAPHLHTAATLPPVIAADTEGRFVVPLVQGTRGEGDTLAERMAARIGAIPVISPSFVIGIGAEKGVPAGHFEAAVSAVLQSFDLAPERVSTIATLDRRAGEEGFRDWATQREWPVIAYTAEQLAAVQEMPNPSAVVAQAVGTPGVCEPAAMLASGSHTLVVPKQKHGRVTVAVARLTSPFSPWEPTASLSLRGRVRADSSELGASTSLTPAFSQGTRGASLGAYDAQERGRVSGDGNTEQEPSVDVSGSQGHGRLVVIGIGPGAADLLTVRAVDAIEAAEVLVGYSGYLQLLGDRTAGKELHGSAIGSEIDRVRLAITLARRGHKVALISSGDAGIYGMAGLVFEELHAQPGTSDQTLDVEVIPGITAAQAAASLLGAPLANDFAVISLSDLLKARETVEGRLEALAAADIVLALYNPQSRTRRELFQKACEVLLQHRHASTPVAVVKAAYRDGQHIEVSNLGHLSDMAVDMESLVLVGNSQTGTFAGQMVTARGQGTLAAEPPDAARHSEAASQAAVSPERSSPQVRFVGAGPGDPELLTLKGAKVLATADVVVYAGSLVPRGVLRHVRPGARIHNSATLTLEETHRLLADAYRAGQQVVRLHSGDPSLYGAITEQMALLDEEQIPYEIVPGVSAFQAVAARLGMEYTQPGVVQTVILTRPGGRTGVPENESLAALAQHGVTLCVFLGARHVVDIQAALLTSYPPTTPVAVAYRATWPEEELTVGTLADLVEMVRGPEYDRTTLMIVGPSLQRQGKRSHLYDPSYTHLFRPGKKRDSGTGSEAGE
jgi:precorrin-4/cobalt-precorrin-4 C11-methyltransferase